MTDLILEMERKDLFSLFTSVRADFEELLLKNDYLIQQIVRKYRSAIKIYPHIARFYHSCIDLLSEGMKIDETINHLIENSMYQYLGKIQENVEKPSKDFSRETKSKAFIREAISSALRCRICRGYIHRNSITIDHIVRKQDGGIGTIENAQLAHPYCNSTFKN